ncbi:MAG TPA: hypothetical protein VGX16_05710, partial [Solirubrobacteraceae bacterium]|nr:hypothetical protein [Solirubrobacteraceae bacterium]
RAGRLRVLHGGSFRDDPTRLLRLARYRVRLGFTVEEETAELAEAALGGGALSTVSGARLGAELRLTLGEPDPLATLVKMHEGGLLRALHPRLGLDAPAARAALELLPGDGRVDLLLLAALTLPLTVSAAEEPLGEARAFLDRLEFPHGDRDRVLAACAAVPGLRLGLPAARESPGALYALAAGVPVEGVALAGALAGDMGAGGPELREAARRWLGEVRHVRLGITGEDLLAAGIPEGPEIGRRLRETLMRRLRGELPDDREAQLRAALGPGRGGN